VRELALKAGKYIQGAQQAAAYEPPSPPPPPPSAPGLDPNNPYSRPYTPNSGAYSPPSGGSSSFFNTAPAGAGASSGGYDPGGNMFGAYSTPHPIGPDMVKRKNGEQMVTILDVVLDMALYAVIIAVAITAFLMVVPRVFLKEYREDVIASTADNANPLTNEDIDLLLDISFGAALVSGLSAGFGSCLSMVFHCGGIHIAATSVLGGKGALVDFMHRYVPFVTYAVLIFTIVLTLGLVLLTVSEAVGSLLMMALFGGMLIYILWSIWLVGKSYELGSFFGCIAIVIGVIISGVISCIFNTMFSSVSALPF
jgi:hypothetical protein